MRRDIAPPVGSSLVNYGSRIMGSKKYDATAFANMTAPNG